MPWGKDMLFKIDGVLTEVTAFGTTILSEDKIDLSSGLARMRAIGISLHVGEDNLPPDGFQWESADPTQVGMDEYSDAFTPEELLARWDNPSEINYFWED